MKNSNRLTACHHHHRIYVLVAQIFRCSAFVENPIQTNTSLTFTLCVLFSSVALERRPLSVMITSFWLFIHTLRVGIKLSSLSPSRSLSHLPYSPIFPFRTESVSNHFISFFKLPLLSHTSDPRVVTVVYPKTMLFGHSANRG